MESTIIFVAVIAIVVFITYFASYPISNKKLSPALEKFTSCPQNPYRRRIVPPINYADLETVKYGEDEDINYHLTNPLVPRLVKEKNNWKSFWNDKFMKGQVLEDDNFKGTSVDEYLNSIQYFHN